MSLRAVPKLLARPAGAAASTLASSPSSPAPLSEPAATAAPSPLLQFPAFHPIPFQQDKFLSIKTRSLETYTKLRGDVLQRCADLQNQVLRHQARTERREAGEDIAHASPSAAIDLEAAVRAAPSAPLTPQQAEELLLLCRKVESLADFQGLVLTDELVWRLFHLCVQCGAPRQALGTWLHKHVLLEKRGPPYPLFVVHDLATLLRVSVLPRLSEGGASLRCHSLLLRFDRSGSVAALQDGRLAARRLLQFYLHHSDGATSMGSHGAPAATLMYTTHLMHEHVWPVWRSLEQMQLTLDTLKPRKHADQEGDDEEGEGNSEGEDLAGEQSNEQPRADYEDEARHSETQAAAASSSSSAASWLPDAAEQTAAVRAALMSITPLYSLHASASTSSSASSSSSTASTTQAPSTRAQMLLAHDPPCFASATDAVVAPLRALLDVWLVVAQCAAEAKDTRLLREIQRTVCVGFLTATPTSTSNATDEKSVVSVNEAAWCVYAEGSPAHKREEEEEQEARSLVHNFVSGVLSVVHYGLLCAEQEAMLWQMYDSCTLTLSAASMWQELCQSRRGNFVAEQQSPSPSSFLMQRDAPFRRLRALAAVLQRQPHPTAEAEEERDQLLLRVLPQALRATARHHEFAPTEETAMEHVTASFLIDTLTAWEGAADSGTEEDHVPSPYAEAGLYVGLATGSEALLQRSLAASTLSAVERERAAETAMLRATATALRSYRHALSDLAVSAPVAAAEEGVNDRKNDDDDDFWPAVLHRVEESRKVEGDKTGSVQTAALLQAFDGCVQTLVLHAARRQAEYAAAYVRAVQHDGDSEESADTLNSIEGREDGTGDVVNGESAVSDEHGAAHTDDSRREAAEAALSLLHQQCTNNIREVMVRVAALLAAADELQLSTASLSSLAVLIQLGTYVNLEMNSAEDEASTPAPAFAASLAKVVERVVSDSCAALQDTVAVSSTPLESAPSSASVGTWVQWVLLSLLTRKDWKHLLQMLTALDGGAERDSLLCCATVDPTVFAAMYAAAQEDGAANVCAFLRPRRQSLFF